MRKLASKFVALIASLALVFLMTACSKPPQELSSRANDMGSVITATKDQVRKAQEAFTTELGKPEYKFLAGASKADTRADKFDTANAKVGEAEKLYNDTVKPGLKDWKDEKQGQIGGALDHIQQLTLEAKDLANQPTPWIKRVAATQKNPAGLVAAMDALVAPQAKIEADLWAKSNAVKAAWPTEAKKIDDRTGQSSRELKAATDALANLRAEAAKPKPNFVVMTSLGDQVKSNTELFQKSSSTTRTQLDELPNSETHTLIDMRVDGEISIGRTSWDENYDGGERDYDYQASKISDGEVLTYFAGFGAGSLLASDGWVGDFGTVDGVDRNMWDKLGINTQENWPGGHNSAEYYLDEVEMTVCQKLRVYKNGKLDSSGRPPATENECDQYNTPADLKKGEYWEEAEEPRPDDIGMDIYSKAAGDFNDQATDAATPPGLAYVGNPQFGEWKQDSNGNEFWQFYFQYLLISNLIGGPSPYYYRNEYNDWNRNYRYSDRDYYGGSGATPRFGASSPGTNTRFPDSNYNKSNLSKPSVRSAGPMNRSGGPGGGGK